MSKSPKDLEDLLLDDSFIRWINGKADRHENQRWNGWISRNPEDRQLAEEAARMMRCMPMKQLDNSDVEAELIKLNNKIDETKIESERPAARVHNFDFYRSVAAAAVILLMLLVGYSVFDSVFRSSIQEQAESRGQTTIQERVISQNEEQSTGSEVDNVSGTRMMTTGVAEKSTLLMEDGSKIVLNAQSELEYPAQLSQGQDVTVHLRGEAYFEVAETTGDRERTFSVQTEDGLVQVLGTEFSVQSRGRQTKVALKKGAVEVRQKNSSKEDASYRMRPGELVQFSKLNNSIEVADINSRIYFSWAGEQLEFDDTPLLRILNRIEQTYGVNIVVRDSGVLEKRISGSIQNNDLGILLNALSELLQKNIEYKNNTITIGQP